MLCAVQILEFEQQYLDALPCAQMYEKSYMHREVVTHCLVTPTDFIITASMDGCVKFWKKHQEGIEFVKVYRAHLGSVDGKPHIYCHILGTCVEVVVIAVVQPRYQSILERILVRD